jgi:Ni/Fe-hydrogenase 1 B-type cytochrome subunit
MNVHVVKHFPVYVWELPVRIWHWTMALCAVVLAATGYLIGSPLPSAGGEASSQFLFGYIRFAHFTAGYVFAVFFAMRVVWAFIGNRFARQIFLVPVNMLSGAWWKSFFDQALYYLYIKRDVRSWQGHDPLAMAAMFFMYVLGSVFMICTGFAMYGEGLGEQSWAFKAFSSWVMPLFGYAQAVHTWHHLGMWYLILFTMVHVYMVAFEDICARETIVSTMVNGWRVTKK